ncbi:unnamed protein product [Mytilus edulis]|uniref:Uncharacterized protein n=1 Tax=Mytilus edulis TaxID=6550 RepID=A0A8S3RSS1_MYTED|nr:unnamed protein product [Mytilus edulis]
MNAEVGLHAYSEHNDDADVLMFDANANAGVQHGIYGAGAGAGAEAHVFNMKGKKAPVEFKAFGVDVAAKAGADLEAFVKKGHVIGAEIKARGTLVDATGGPFNVHLGVGVSTGAKIENGTVEAKVAGCGLKLGKRIGIAILDNEITVEALSLVGKGWLWGSLDE